MGNWSGKFLIGLTGNIATGKSLVREMLEYLGAQGVDADKLAHDAIKKGSPGYDRVIQEFGESILTPDLTIDRSKLADIVFTDQHAMMKLESIIHPLVAEEINILIVTSSRNFLVLEAIKLIEANLYLLCDSIWVTVAAPDLQLERLKKSRDMDETEAMQRIEVQSKTENKIRFADVIIQNNGSLEYLWEQVVTAWKSITHESVPSEKIPDQFLDEISD